MSVTFDDAERAFASYGGNSYGGMPTSTTSAAVSESSYFNSRAEAAAALLRKTWHSSGAKHFAAGGLTVHVNDVVLARGVAPTLPKPLRMEVALLGETVHSFSVDVDPGAGQDPSKKDKVRLGQVICYEVEPQTLADQLVALPRCEFRLYAPREASHVASKVRVNGGQATSGGHGMKTQEELIGMAEHDLAGQSEDLVNVPLRLERVASWLVGKGASEQHDASESLGELVVSVVAERSTGDSSQLRAEGGSGIYGSASGYGSGYGALDSASRENAYTKEPKIPSTPGVVRNKLPMHYEGASAYRALPSPAYSRPGSAKGSRAGSVLGFGSSSVRGAGSVVSASGLTGASGKSSSAARKGFTETPVGFQYKSIPTRYLTPQGYQPPDDDAMSEGGRSFGGASSAAPSQLTARSLATATAKKGGAIDSHVLAEGFWSQWRTRQVGDLAPGKVAVVVECRYDQGGMSTRHNGEEYERYVEKVKVAVRNAFGESALAEQGTENDDYGRKKKEDDTSLATCIIVPENRGSFAGSRAFANWQTAHGARLGAFEVGICYHQSGFGIVSELVHSKLISKKWPSSRKLEAALKSLRRSIILRPLLVMDNGSEVPVTPIPPNLFIRMGSSSAIDGKRIKAEIRSVGPMPGGPRTLAGTFATEPGGEAEAAEARRRIAEFMETHEVVFNGAGEDLTNVAQSWSVKHTKPLRARKNTETIRGVAAILRQYPDLKCEVHGETGKARSAPPKLASHLRISDPVKDVAKAMDVLAQKRAEACLDALVAEGIPEEQLFLTYKGMGGQSHADFVPTATTGSKGTSKVASSTSSREKGEEASAFAFKLMKGSDDDCYICLDDTENSMYEPFAEPLSNLLLGTTEIGEGVLDVPVRLTPKAASFEMQIEFMKRGTGTLASQASVLLRTTGSRASTCDLPHGEFEVSATNGRYILKWSGHAEAIELVQGGEHQRCDVWPGRKGVQGKRGKDGRDALPTWRIQYDPNAKVDAQRVAAAQAQTAAAEEAQARNAQKQAERLAMERQMQEQAEQSRFAEQQRMEMEAERNRRAAEYEQRQYAEQQQREEQQRREAEAQRYRQQPAQRYDDDYQMNYGSSYTDPPRQPLQQQRAQPPAQKKTTFSPQQRVQQRAPAPAPPPAKKPVVKSSSDEDDYGFEAFGDDGLDF